MEGQFCPDCQSLLDLPGDDDHIKCRMCGLRQRASVFENQPVITRTRDGQYGDIFGRVVKSAAGRKAAKEGTRNEGATIDEKCPKCGNPEMTFHTMQLRSADEGQTVFYACPKCSYTYKVNT